ncbi:MAG: hypothetical protein HEEMFOPI_01314 [Holosporales bacterium]
MYFRLFLLNCTLLSVSYSATHPSFSGGLPHPVMYNPYATGLVPYTMVAKTPCAARAPQNTEYQELKNQLKHLEDQFDVQRTAQQKSEQDTNQHCERFSKLLENCCHKQKEIEAALLVLEQKAEEDTKRLFSHQECIKRFLETFPKKSDEIFKTFQARLSGLENQISQIRRAPSREELSALEKQARALVQESTENKQRIENLENKIVQIQKMLQAPKDDGFAEQLLQQNRTITNLEKKLTEIKDALKNANQKKLSPENDIQVLKRDLEKQFEEIRSKTTHLSDVLKEIEEKLKRRHIALATQTEEPEEDEAVSVLLGDHTRAAAAMPQPEQEQQSVVLEKPDEKHRDMKALMKQKISELEKKIKCEPKYNLIIKNVIKPFMEKHFPALSIIESFDENDPQFWTTVQEIIARAHQDKELLENFKTLSRPDLIEMTSGFLQANQKGIRSTAENKENANNLILFIVLSISYIVDNGNELMLINHFQKAKAHDNIRLLEVMIFTILEKIRIQVDENLKEEHDVLNFMKRLKLNFYPILNIINQYVFVFNEVIYEKALKIIDAVIENEIGSEKSEFIFLAVQRHIILKNYLEAILQKAPEYRQDNTNIQFNNVIIKFDGSFGFQALKILQIISKKKERLTEDDLKLVDTLFKTAQVDIPDIYQDIFSLPFTVAELTEENARILMQKYARLGVWRIIGEKIIANGTDIEKGNFENIKKMLSKKTVAATL